MKKILKIGSLSLGLLTIGTLVSVPMISTSCSSGTTDDNVIPEDKLNVENGVLKGFITGYEPPSNSKLVVPSGVTAINDLAFYRCTSLTTMDLTGLTGNIGRDAFAFCSNLTGTLTIGSNVTSIGNQAFFCCTGLTGIFFIRQHNLTSIGSQAFDGCASLTGTLTITSGVNFIGDAAFNGAKFTDIINLSSAFSFANNVGTAKVLIEGSNGVLNYSSGKAVGSLAIGALTIPNSVTTIGQGVFYSCNNLTGNLTIPNNVTAINSYAFSGCTGLTGTLTIGSNVTNIGYHAFYYDGFTGNINIPNKVTLIDNGAFEKCTGFNALVIAGTTVTINESAFNGCSEITSIQANWASQPSNFGGNVFIDWKSSGTVKNTDNGYTSQQLRDFLVNNCGLPNGWTAIN